MALADRSGVSLLDHRSPIYIDHILAKNFTFSLLFVVFILVVVLHWACFFSSLQKCQKIGNAIFVCFRLT